MAAQLWILNAFNGRNTSKEKSMRFRTLSIVVLALAVPYATGAASVFRFTTIDVGAYGTYAMGINSSGQIVGTVYDNLYCDDSGCYPASPHGFLWDSGSVTPIDVPGAYATVAYGINGTGQIVGMFSDATGSHGFLKDGNAFTRIDVPGASGTVAYGINGTGQIVGSFFDVTGTHGFLWVSGSVTTVDVPGVSGTSASTSTAPDRSSDRSGMPPATTAFSGTRARSRR